jgi:formylglycine-generating enzyme required for sulfatase activity
MGNKPRLFHDLTLSNEYPAHLRWLPDFFIAQTPVINAKYALFKCYRPPAIVSLNQRRAPPNKRARSGGEYFMGQCDGILRDGPMSHPAALTYYRTLVSIELLTLSKVSRNEVFEMELLNSICAVRT